VIAWLVIRAVLCQKMIPTDNHRSKPSATPCRAVWATDFRSLQGVETNLLSVCLQPE
jgi:hypothetical protein